MFLKLFHRAFLLCFVFAFCQAPFFVNEYLVRLEGHLAESNLQIQTYLEAAKLSKKSLTDYIDKFLTQEDADFKHQGIIIQEAKNRNEFLERGVSTIEGASPLLRPFVFIRYADATIIRETWETFSIGLSVSLESLLWAFLGWIVGYLVLTGLRQIIHRQPKETA